MLGEQKENEKPDEGYQIQRWWQKPGNELQYLFGTQIPQLGGVLKESLVDPVVEASQSAQRMNEDLPKGIVMFGHVIPTDGGEPVPIKSWDNTLQGAPGLLLSRCSFLALVGRPYAKP